MRDASGSGAQTKTEKKRVGNCKERSGGGLAGGGLAGGGLATGGLAGGGLAGGGLAGGGLTVGVSGTVSNVHNHKKRQSKKSYPSPFDTKNGDNHNWTTTASKTAQEQKSHRELSVGWRLAPGPAPGLGWGQAASWRRT